MLGSNNFFGVNLNLVLFNCYCIDGRLGWLKIGFFIEDKEIT